MDARDKPEDKFRKTAVKFLLLNFLYLFVLLLMVAIFLVVSALLY